MSEPLTAEEEAALRADMASDFGDALAPEERHLMRRVLATLDAARPSGEVDVHAAYREGRRAVWTELIELAEQGIQASSEPTLDGRREETT